MQAALAQALDAWLQRSLSVQHTVDPNLIRDTVAQTMRNMWQEMSQKSTPLEEGARHWGVQSGKNI